MPWHDMYVSGCLSAGAAVFDGHSGFAAAQYLSEHLYDSFSEAIDEGSYGPECTFDGVTCSTLYIATLWTASAP